MYADVALCTQQMSDYVGMLIMLRPWRCKAANQRGSSLVSQTCNVQPPMAMGRRAAMEGARNGESARVDAWDSARLRSCTRWGAMIPRLQ